MVPVVKSHTSCPISHFSSLQADLAYNTEDLENAYVFYMKGCRYSTVQSKTVRVLSISLFYDTVSFSSDISL
jgi:hypothetical protein